VNGLRVLAMLALAAALAGCAMIDKLLGIEPKSPLKELRVVTLAGANSNSATALDIVFVYDDLTLTLLPKTGPEWFANKTALLAATTLSVDVLSLQVQPDWALDGVTLPKRHKEAVAVYSYANYISAGGQPVGKLTPYKCVQLMLGATAVAYVDCAKKGSTS
jgi:type VI secretion system protein